MVRTGGRADGQYALDVQKQHDSRRLRDHAHIQPRSGRAGIRGGKALTRPRPGEDVAVSPDILLHDQHAAGQDEPDRLRRIARAQQKRVLRIIFLPGIQTGEHCRQLRLGYAGKER